MRLYISADIEGVAGVASRDQGGPGAFEYEPARQWMTSEVIAACEAAFDSGIVEVVVCDSHGNGQNILPEQLPESVQLVRSLPRPLGMMQGVEMGDYVGAVLLGYHAGATNPDGLLAHTMSSKAIRDIRLNGISSSETDISTAIAAHYGVPVILASGDDVYLQEVEATQPLVERVQTKIAYGMTSVCGLSPKASCTAIRQGVKSALARLEQFNAQPAAGPIALSVSFTYRSPAELLAYLPGVTRSDAYTIEISVKDILELSRVLTFIGSYQLGSR
jgi:D-amino peptidase